MKTIEIDFDVYKEITIRRDTEEVTENDVLRKIFGLESEKQNSDVSGKPWIVKGITFPEGTLFRANYKGSLHTGQVADGALKLNEQLYSSPSKAAVSITGNNVNGWRFWECKLPGQASWKLMSTYR